MTTLLVANSTEYDGTVARKRNVCFKVDRKNVLQSSEVYITVVTAAFTGGSTVSRGQCHVSCLTFSVMPASAQKLILCYTVTHNLQYRQPLKRSQFPARDYALQEHSPYYCSMVAYTVRSARFLATAPTLVSDFLEAVIRCVNQ